jgi:two-component system chemotaxis response regulator CheY
VKKSSSERKMKVLIVDDDPVTRSLLKAFLHKWDYEVVIARGGTEAWEILQEPESPSLVVSDWIMPDMNGLDLCRKVRQAQAGTYTYIIVLTGKGQKEDVVEALEAGADDYLIKPFNQEELKYRIRTGERIIKLEQKILELAHTDFLTGVLNRRAFIQRMEAEIHRAAREHAPISLILADIDHFKKINDRYGHNTGDIVLQRFARKLSECLRPYDFVGRYGGEEFIIYLPNVKETQAILAAERMRKSIEETKIIPPNSLDSIQITASFGIALSWRGAGENVLSIIERADFAMYKAKREGRNRVRTAGEGRKEPVTTPGKAGGHDSEVPHLKCYTFQKN